MLRSIELMASLCTNRVNEIVDVLENLLKEAREGNVDNIVIVAHVGPEMMRKTICSGEIDAMQMIGALEQAKFALLRELMPEQNKHSTTTL